MRAVNPATGDLIRDYREHTAEEMDALLRRAHEAFLTWREVPLGVRAEKMHRAAQVLRGRRDLWARLMTAEMGKTLLSAGAEVDKCAWVCDHYADHAAGYLAPEPVGTDAGQSFVRFDPLGPVLAVMPWNFPFWQVFRFAAPALMAGNVGLLKHASNVPGCALGIEEVFREAGFPEGCFTALLVGAGLAERAIAHPAVVAVTLTGSEPAGSKVAAAAGAALKKTVLELGGSDPFVVLADSEVEAVAKSAAVARCINNGQSCIAAKRFIVEAPVAERFEAAFAEAMSALRVGDPLDPGTDVGPLAREDLLLELHDQVERAVRGGARLVVGGKRLGGPGYFYAPTVLSDVAPGNPAFEEETFGPVAAVTVARDQDEAVALANRSRYGLGASVWTGDPQRGIALAARIESGAVFVNGIVKSDPRLPFGGVKASGYGRELAAFGIREFVNIKSVWVR